MISLFIVHRPRRWCTTNEAREVKGLSHGCSPWLSIGLKAPACQVSLRLPALSLTLSYATMLLLWVTLTVASLLWVWPWPALRCVFTFIVVPP
jgi:hypothetical protein